MVPHGHPVCSIVHDAGDYVNTARQGGSGNRPPTAHGVRTMPPTSHAPLQLYPDMVRSAKNRMDVGVWVAGRRLPEMKPSKYGPKADGWVESNLHEVSFRPLSACHSPLVHVPLTHPRCYSTTAHPRRPRQATSYPVKTVEPDPFGEPCEQSWPVTPYEIKVTNNESTDRYLRVYVDGQRVNHGGGTVRADKTRTFSDHLRSDGTNLHRSQLLFARPQIVAGGGGGGGGGGGSGGGSADDKMGTIRVDLHDIKGQNRVMRRTDPSKSAAGFEGAKMQDHKKAKASSGTQTGPAVTKKHRKYKTSVRTGNCVDSVVIRYANQDRLRGYGVWQAGASARAAIPVDEAPAPGSMATKSGSKRKRGGPADDGTGSDVESLQDETEAAAAAKSAIKVWDLSS